MYNVRQLSRIAWNGLQDLVPSIRRAFSEPEPLSELRRVYGPRPRVTIVVVAGVLALAGEWFARFGLELPLKEYVDWPAVFVGAAFALMIRRYLFRSGQVEDDDFFWLAASLVPPVVICIVVSPFANLVWGSPGPDSDAQRLSGAVGSAALLMTRELGLAAALTIAFGALIYSRNWLRALINLAIRLAVFRLMIWVTALVLIDIGLIGRILGGILAGIFGLHLPQWLKDLSDQLSYALLLSTAYLAIIGGTWTTCRKTFVELLRTGHVDILAALEAQARPRSKRKKAAQNGKEPRVPPDGS